MRSLGAKGGRRPESLLENDNPKTRPEGCRVGLTSPPSPAFAQADALATGLCWVEVVAAVLWREDGAVLLGQRGAGTFYPGYWEFPGGKVETGETPVAALRRELAEELTLELSAAVITPWLVRPHVYEHAAVRLRFFQVWGWRGQPQPQVHAALAWQRPGAWSVAPMLPANAPVLEALRLPPRVVVTNVRNDAGSAPVGAAAWQAALARQRARLERAAEQGAFAVIVREGEDIATAQAVVHLARTLGAAEVWVNGPVTQAQALGADGVHLSAQRARRWADPEDCEAQSERRCWQQWGGRLGVSVHDAAEREVARWLVADYWLVGSVLPTATHPEATPLGWDGLAQLAAEAPAPVYAIGGLSEAHLARARAYGAHGIAAIRNW